jgi:RNA polymerase sigma-70 factor (ECF subfamily)
VIGPVDKNEERAGLGELSSRLRAFIGKRVPAADVDDVLQNVFLRMQRGLATLRHEERFGPWAYQVTRSAIADYRRARHRHPIAEGDPPDSIGVDPREDDGDAGRALAHYVAPFIAMLPSPYREALTLTELEGLSQAAAAQMMGVSLSGMKSRVQRGRTRLRELLDGCCVIALDLRGRVVSFEPRSPESIPEGCCPPAGCECRPGPADEADASLRETAEQGNRPPLRA